MSTTTPKPVVGRFELHAELGRGFHGRVYLAWDPKLERRIALKLLLGAGGDPASREKFVAEARAAARLAHPNVIPIFDAGVHGKVPYLVFEYVEGETLRRTLRKRGGLPWPTAVPLFRQVLDGVAAAHEQRVAHLDLSPGNLMVDRQSRVRVMDFGLARFAGVDPEGAQASPVRGTPRYMSPEHFCRGELDVQTDVFALGLILFELLAGTPAVPAGVITEMRDSIMRGKFDFTPVTRLDVPPEIVAVIRDAMATCKATRYRDAGEMRRALEDAMRSRRSAAEGDVALRFLMRRLQRRTEFPAFSNSIMEINRLTADDSMASLDQLATAIQRDFALTNRLMKVANSSMFDRRTGGVTTVSQAIRLVGTRIVRMLCNGLQFFDKLKADRPTLEDGLVGSFVAGLMARHLGQRLRRDLAEEAFICGLFNRLGRNLVIYYLEDEHEEIERCVAAGAARVDAELRVLGTTCAALGTEVASTWRFPPTLVESMAPPLVGGWRDPATPGAALHVYAHLANEMCELASGGTRSGEDGLEELAARYSAVLCGDPVLFVGLFGAALDKFRELAPLLGVNVARNGFLDRAAAWRAHMEQSTRAPAAASA